MEQEWQNQYEEFGAPLKKAASQAADDVSSPESMPEYDRVPPRYIDKYIKPELPFISKRATVALFCCLGFIIMFGMRESMGMLKAETNKTSAAADSAIFWGYFVTQIPGGLIAAAYPANRLFGAAIGSSCLLNMLVPAVIDDYPTLMIIVKVMQGLVEGVTYPACHGIMSRWAPPLERSKLATVAFSGCYAGVMFSMPISGMLMNTFGNFAPFYFYGVVGIFWYILWLFLIFEKPSLHTCIDAKELMYIENSLGQTQNYVKPTLANTPWKSFFTSMPCYAIFVANFCRSWNFYLLVIFQPLYFSDVYKSKLKENALFGPLPHLLMTIVVPTGGILADRLRRKGILTTTQVRKLFNCGGFGMEATFFIIMAYSQTLMQGVTALTIGVAFSGFAISGFNVNHLDIAPRYASILMGMSNGIGTIAGCICPMVVDFIVKDKTVYEWREVFVLSAFVHYAGVVFYGLFASGELQPWADPTAEEEKQWNQMNEAPPKKLSGQNNGLLRRPSAPGGGHASYGSVETPLPPSRPPPPPPGRPSFDAPAAPSVGWVPEAPATAPPPAGVYPQLPAGGNPFISSKNPFRQEAVQPPAEDVYMHGTVQDREY